MKSKIRILDEQTINLIAAGEVIEDPSSVVKELVDNAIDSGATKIVIQVQGSGRISIIVQDNGCGMCRDDALLCFERHATSKIRKADDLWDLHTMGFRGEALASIAAVAEVSLLTAEKTEAYEAITKGALVVAQFGKVKSCQEANAPCGTTITVRSLFQNVPARRKFQKSPAREAQEIVKVVLNLALAQPEISFELSVNGAKDLFCEIASKDAFRKRVLDILGSEYLSEMLPVEYKKGDFEFFGFLGKPFVCRVARSGQMLFINGRPIDSPFISSCIRKAYGTSIEETKHPLFCLHIHTAKDSVDMNVHPQKKQARFCIEEELEAACLEMVQKTLFSFSPPPAKEGVPEPRSASFSLPPKPFFTAPLPPPLQQEFTLAKEAFRVIGTVWHYIFAQFPGDEEQFSCIDAKVGCAKIAADAMKGKAGLQPAIQTLLKPIFFEASREQYLAVMEVMERLEKRGILVREFGTNSFIIEGYASCYEYVDVKALIFDFAETKEEASLLLGKLQPKIELPITESQAFQILKKILASPDPWTGPQGESIRVLVSKQELMKRF